jgi:membrane protease YdiL (CAAX protease family)
MRRDAWLALAALIGGAGLFVVLTLFFLSVLGLTQQGLPANRQEAFLALLKNSISLLLVFGGSALLVYPKWRQWASTERLFEVRMVPMAVWIWTALLMLGLLPALPWIGLDESSFRLPAAWRDWETSLEAIEAQAEMFVRLVLMHGALGWNLLFMAVVPAFAEEVFFRGALQSILSRLVSPVAAIWVTAILFSAVHVQVYGFIPRVLLGAFMGYLAWYGRSLTLAIWAHFLNNAYMTIMGYFVMRVFEWPELISSSYRPPVWMALLGAAVAGLAGYRIYQLLRRRD